MLTPLKVLQLAAKALETLDCTYCLVGGHAASLYRQKERLTIDVDFALVSDSPGQSRQVAEECMKRLGLEMAVGFIPVSDKEDKRKSICLISSKPSEDELTGLLDILLPELPWVEQAVERAQHNVFTLGFGEVPVITPEDLIIAKCYSVRNNPERFQDLDDLKELLIGDIHLDWDYLRGALARYKLSLPEQLQKYSPL